MKSESIPKLEMRELSEEESKKAVEPLRDFQPMFCKKCGNKKDLKKRLFALSIPVNHSSVEKQIRRILKEKYNLKYYGYYEDEKNIIINAKCPVCGSEKMFWNY